MVTLRVEEEGEEDRYDPVQHRLGDCYDRVASEADDCSEEDASERAGEGKRYGAVEHSKTCQEDIAGYGCCEERCQEQWVGQYEAGFVVYETTEQQGDSTADNHSQKTNSM